MVAIRMTRQAPSSALTSVLVLALVSACDTAATKESSPASPVPIDWSKQAVKPTSVEVDGQKFQVSLPDGLELEIKKGDGTFPGYANWTSSASHDDPSFLVQSNEFPPRDLDDAVRKLESGKYKATVKDAVDGGFLVAVVDDPKELLKVELVKKGKSGKWYGFSILQRARKPIANLDATQAWMLATVKTFVIE